MTPKEELLVGFGHVVSTFGVTIRFTHAHPSMTFTIISAMTLVLGHFSYACGVMGMRATRGHNPESAASSNSDFCVMANSLLLKEMVMD